MTLEERILKLKDSQVGWFDGYELRVIAEDVCKMEKRIKRLEEAAQRVDDAAHSIQDWSGTVLGDALDELNKAKEAKP